jgi:hypothetical protein
MTKTLLAALALTCLSTFAHAQSCAVQAGDKKLAGAAKTSFLTQMREGRHGRLRQAGRGQEARRRGQDELHQEMRHRFGRHLSQSHAPESIGP